MSSDVLDIVALSLVSMFNPTLLAAVTVMLLLPNPRRLMLGYLLGAYLTSTTLSLLTVFTLQGSSAVSTTQNSLSPAEDILFGLVAVVIAFALGTGRDQPFQARRQQRKDEKMRAKQEAGKPTESYPLRMLGRGSPRITFAVGAVLSFPGASYLATLNHVAALDASTTVTVLVILACVVVQQMLLELPLIGYAVAPEWTQGAVERFRVWISTRGRHAGIVAAAVLGVLLIVRGLIALLT